MRQILLATDGSPCSDRATVVAEQLAKAFEARLRVLTVGGKNVFKEAAREMVPPANKLGDVLDAIAEEALSRARARALALGAKQVLASSGWGDAAEVIIEFARQDHSDAIVVGRRGLGQLSGFFLGSISPKLVALPPSVVVVVP